MGFGKHIKDSVSSIMFHIICQPRLHVKIDKNVQREKGRGIKHINARHRMISKEVPIRVYARCSICHQEESVNRNYDGCKYYSFLWGPICIYLTSDASSAHDHRE